MFKQIGNMYQGINSISEGVKKKRDAKKMIALAESRARNAEQQDFVNQSAQIKVDSKGTDRALENINLGATQAFSQASDAGIRGIGMIGKILQNVNDATFKETQALADRQFQVDKMAASEANQQEQEQQRIFEKQQGRTDQMLERGQAMRSQGSAEIGQGASQTGGAMDDAAKEAVAVASGIATGGLAGGIAAIGSTESQDKGSNSQFYKDKFGSMLDVTRTFKPLG